MKKLKNIIILARPHQYVKNLFIFLPLFFVGQMNNIDLFYNAFIAFLSFSFCASAVYILNDYLDVELDKLHPKKKYRPLASGLISEIESFVLIGVFTIAGLLMISSISSESIIILLVYIFLNIAYCFYLKHIVIIDVVIISVGFILRIILGSFVTGIPLSMWIVIMTFLLALFLAFAKRRDDVVQFLNTGKIMRKVIVNYNLKFIDSAMSIFASVIIVSYILYTTSSENYERFNSEYLYMTTFFVIVGILRYLHITFVKNQSGSPTKALLNDKFTAINIIFWILSYTYLLYING
jgi:decaprenyl-phosphate phosphoribosyltransferase